MDIISVLHYTGWILIAITLTAPLAADAAGVRLSEKALFWMCDACLWVGFLGAALVGIAMKMAVS